MTHQNLPDTTECNHGGIVGRASGLTGLKRRRCSEKHLGEMLQGKVFEVPVDRLYNPG
jgi:hypothetical protein